MLKRYNLASGDCFTENIFIDRVYLNSFMKGSPIKSVSPVFTQVYHIFDSTARFDRQSKPDILHPLKRTSANAFLEIYASNKRKIERTVRYLEEITLKEFEEVKGD